MKRDGYEADSRRSLPARAVLVALLLVGLLGMHGLGSPAPSHGESHPGAPHAADAPTDTMPAVPATASMESAASVTSVPDDGGPRQERACHGHGDGSAHHSAHADDLCAAGGISGAPALSVPDVSSLAPAHSALRPHLPARYEPEGGRAPPSLAELQLLRI
ncbi:DUF6153 family protein [Streptomyces axinellae]|uniref:DUF6153 family protein n=1 Tax=Streptomyces axinellae TaxID=552788 RepID=A0ABN3PZK6_9ACTN